MKKLSDSTKEQLKQQLLIIFRSGMFGDGLESEYIMYGFPVFKGLNNLADIELVQEYEQSVDESDSLLAKAKAELGL